MPVRIANLIALSTSLLFAEAVAEPALNWPQFRGPAGMADAGEQSIPSTFGPSENLLWTTEAPEGHSSPCIWGDLLFISGHRNGELLMLAYDRETGSLVWNRSVAAQGEVDFIHRAASPAQPTPCANQEGVYFYFGAYGLIALDFDGNRRWEKRLSLPKGNFGTGSSPIIFGDSLILVRDNTDDPCVLSLDTRTGATKWKHPRIGYRNSQSTPFLWTNSLRQELVVPGSGSLVSLDPLYGELLWKVNDTCSMPCATPAANRDALFFAGWAASHVGGRDMLEAHFEDDIGFTEEEIVDPSAFFRRFDADKDGFISRKELPRSRALDVFKWIDRDRDDLWSQDEYTILLRPASGGRNVMVAVRAGGDGILNGTPHLAWDWMKRLPYVPSPLASGNRVYLVRSLGIVTCLDAETGLPFYEGARTGVKGEYYASPVKCGNKVLITSSLGSVIVIRDSDTFEIISKNEIGEEIFATPAIVDDTLYIRSAQSLWAFR